jgi:hypothetical protein
MSRYRYKKIYAWDSSLAYCVGLIASDGSLSKSGRHIDFTTIDYELAETYRSCLRSRAKIGTKKNSAGITSYRVQIGDTSLYDFLASLNMTPNKSQTISELKVPDDYYADFLRGVFDGDGTSYSYMDVRWKNSYMYYACFTSASKDFLLWLQCNNYALSGCSKGSITDKSLASKACRLSYAKRDTKLLYKFMYYQNDLPHLKRKKQKLDSYFT